MAEKATKTRIPQQISASDIARLAAQTDSVRGLADRIAAAQLPTAAAVKNIVASLPDLKGIKNQLAAADIARSLSQNDAFKQLAKNVSASAIPKVDLKLPALSRAVQISLPRPLSEADLPFHREQPHGAEREDSEVPSQLAGGELIDVLLGSPEALGRLVRAAREKRRLSQQAFADLAGVGRRFVSELENGKATLEFGKVLKVARAAGISLLARSL